MKAHPEDVYLRLVRDVIDRGERDDRTGTGTMSLFGTQSRYDLSNGTIPLSLPSRCVRSIIEELLWFIHQ